MMRLKIAFRNTFRNKRRTLLNLAMIAGGVTAIAVFEGFALSLVIQLQETTIKTQTGHMQIASQAYWKRTAKTPKEGLLPETKALRETLQRIPHVRSVSGRISFYGLIGKGEQSFSIRGLAYDVERERRIENIYHFVSGVGFRKPDGYQIILGNGVANRLKTKVNDRITLLANTYDGVVNALDVEVIGTFNTGISEFDDSTIIVPLKIAQKLLDTKGVEQLIIFLDRTSNTPETLAAVRSILPPGLAVKSWSTIAKLYRQVAGFNEAQNRIIEFIILSLILLAILNTIGMSIFERTGEIGTIAALGETRKSILVLFLYEGIILGVLGSICGAILAVIVIKFINSANLQIMMPGASSMLTIHIKLYPVAFRQAMFLSILAASFAAFIPAIRASRMNIADALRRNI